jgi:hypothetical protein
MPCRPWEEDAHITELPHPVTPMNLPDNDGVGHGHDNLDAERVVTQSDDNAELGWKKKKEENCQYCV